ncbi:MAG: hypothetical protein KDJ65_31280 [Anaerolineae bacterium]|nr:hypothetical protein [Anaerolineae bacterium]
MKKLIVILSVSLLVLVTTAAVYAKGVKPVAVATANDGGGLCAVGVALEDGSAYKFVGTYKITEAKNGAQNTMIQCQGTLGGSTEPPQSAIRADGDLYDGDFSCFGGGDNDQAERWWVNISPSGQATYKCQINPGH